MVAVGRVQPIVSGIIHPGLIRKVAKQARESKPEAASPVVSAPVTNPGSCLEFLSWLPLMLDCDHQAFTSLFSSDCFGHSVYYSNRK